MPCAAFVVAETRRESLSKRAQFFFRILWTLAVVLILWTLPVSSKLLLDAAPEGLSSLMFSAFFDEYLFSNIAYDLASRIRCACCALIVRPTSSCAANPSVIRPARAAA